MKKIVSSRLRSSANLEQMEKLPSPAAVRKLLPLSPALKKRITAYRKEVAEIICGENSARKLLAITGPCSIHNPDSALRYAEKLRELAQKVSGEFFILMRVYFEKPRTTTGWKGLIYDPDLNGEYNIGKGIMTARKLMLEIAEKGLPIATELLDPVTAPYLEDIVSWAGIGARTVESPTHRQFASGLSIPIGFKNGTDGNVQIAIDAIRTARAPHSYIGMLPSGHGGVFRTRGNPNGHLVLRGSSHGINYDAVGIGEAKRKLTTLPDPPRILVDCSHGNSAKDYKRQRIAFQDVIIQCRAGERGIAGVMLESYLMEGKQNLYDGIAPHPEISITDGCISFDETNLLLLQASAILKNLKDLPPEMEFTPIAPADPAKETLRELPPNGTIAYLGPDGTFSQLAARSRFGSPEGKSYTYLPCRDIRTVFESILEGKADTGVLPIENSTSGVVTQTLDLLLKYPLKITEEFAIPIHQCLLANCPQNKIKTLFAHPQSRSQCSSFLRNNLPNVEVLEVESNALAAEMAAKTPGSAALGCESASEIYKLNIIEKNIADTSGNMTRFLIVDKEEAAPTKRDKTSICFCIADRTGALYSCLEPFHRHHITLTMIESRPSRHQRWEYLFYVDLLGNKQDPEVAAALRELEANTSFVKIFGSYPSLVKE